MDCPYCKASLVHWDTIYKSDKITQVGHVLVCPTDTCSNPCNHAFHKYHDTEVLKEGLPDNG